VQNRELYERIIYQRSTVRAAGIPLLVVDARDYQVLRACCPRSTPR
jgi:hypothetical protein